MPKKIDAKIKERCVSPVLQHQSEYSSLTAAAEVVARREGLGKETVRRWVVQAQIDGGQRQGATSEELAEIKELKSKVRRLEEDNETCGGPQFPSRGSSTPATDDRRFRRELTAEGFAVESICRVLRQQGCQVAARTYRSWRAPSRTVSGRTIGDALVIDAVRDNAWTTAPLSASAVRRGHSGGLGVPGQAV